MGEYGHEQTLDVVRGRVSATLDESDGARHAIEREAATDRGAHLQLLELTRRAHDLHDPAAEKRIDVHALDRREQLRQLVPRDDRLQAVQWMAVNLALDDPDLLVEAGVSE